jgi:hypothetical protein
MEKERNQKNSKCKAKVQKNLKVSRLEIDKVDKKKRRIRGQVDLNKEEVKRSK